MAITTALHPAQISFFNPGRLTDEQIERAFVARQSLFRFIFEKIAAEQPGEIPQHLLIIGERGMGKSTLLHRLAVELRKTPHNQVFIPLTFPEEQYNTDRLSKFWLNCLDALADALDRSALRPDILADLDVDIRRWERNGRDITAAEMYGHFTIYCQRLQRRPVLLVDNLNLILNALKTEEKHALRALLMEKNAPILVGAGVQVIEETVSYTAPFYDAFQQFHLKKLSFEEAIDTLRNLAEITQNTSFAQQVAGNRGRLRALYQLTGGTPRTLTMLYHLIRDGFSENLQTDLEGLMDMATALYKARFEELPVQMQVVLDAVALHWDPIHLEGLRQITHLESAQLSPQLKRLQDLGWLHRLDAYEAKGSAYEISERFFNIWYLMRRSTRRRKKELLCLTKFLSVFYGEELPQVARQALNSPLRHPDHVSLQLALADALKDEEMAQQLRDHSYKALMDWAERDATLLKNFAVPEAFVSEKERAVFEEVQGLIRTKDYGTAERKLNFLIALNPQNATYYNNLGNLYQTHLQRYTEAEQAYLNAIEIDPAFAAPWNGLGNLYQYHLQRYPEAEKAYQKASVIDPATVAPWYNLGNLYQTHLQRYPEAEQSYQKAIEINPAHAYVWNNLGNLQTHLQRYPEAEQAYQKAIEIDAEYAASWYNLGHLYQTHLQRYPEAEWAYQKAIEIDPALAVLWNNLGNLYQDHLQRYPEAEQAYQKAIESDPVFAFPWNNLGNLYKTYLQRYPEAEKAYQKAIEINPAYNYAWNGLGNLYQDYLHQYPEAEEAYQKALAINPKEVASTHNLIFLYRDKMGQMERAKLLFETVDKESGLADTWYLHSALFALHDKNLGIAAAELEKALQTVDNALPPYTQDDWWRFAAAVHRLGYAREVLDVMEKTGHHITLRPFYEAIKTLAEGTDQYLNSVAVEVREPAKLILEKIRRIGNL